MTLTNSERSFLPAAGRDLFLPLYDPLTRLLGLDRWRRALLDQAGLRPHDRVLDVGCGTGSLAVLIRKEQPTVGVVGVDPDVKALARARGKAERAGLSIRFDQGFADALGSADEAFDRVFSSMMFHHLGKDEKSGMLREVRRVLKPGGRLELLDFSGPDADLHGAVSRLVHSHRRLKGNSPAEILRLMADAGFVDAGRLRSESTIFGRLVFYQAIA